MTYIGGQFRQDCGIEPRVIGEPEDAVIEKKAREQPAADLDGSYRFVKSGGKNSARELIADVAKWYTQQT